MTLSHLHCSHFPALVVVVIIVCRRHIRLLRCRLWRLCHHRRLLRPPTNGDGDDDDDEADENYDGDGEQNRKPKRPGCETRI